MEFVRRDLGMAAEPVAVSDLVVGSVFYMVSYIDMDLEIPQIQPIVFIGENLTSGDSGLFYFQDAGSYLAGERPQEAESCGDAEDREHEEYSYDVHALDSSSISSVFSLEKAVDEVIRCLQRGRERSINTVK